MSDDDKITKLEARVAQLEKIVGQLIQAQDNLPREVSNQIKLASVRSSKVI